jgi:acid phosphatase (class A)
MKMTYLMTLCLMLCCTLLHSQDNALSPRPFALPEYYTALQRLNPKPASGNEKLDNEKFPFDPASAAKRLSLKPYYLEGTTVNDFKIPDYPANSSEQTRAELNYLLRLQNQRTNYDIQSSLVMAGIYYNPRVTAADSSYHVYRQNLFHIGRSMGSWFTPDNLPETADFLANVWRDASYFIWTLKYKHLRVRPYVLDERIENMEETNWAAYPSGHASNSYVNAYIFSAISPEHTDIFLRDAYDMAHSREILGVHFPSDSEAGRLFAKQFVDKLFANKKFVADFEKVKREWKDKKSVDFLQPVQSIKSSLSDPESCGKAKNKSSSCAKKCE